LQGHRPAVVDVPFTRGQPVSLTFSPFSGHSTLHISYSGTSQRQKYGGSKRKQRLRRLRRRRKRKRSQGMQRMQGMLLQAVHSFLRAASLSNLVVRPRPNHL
jgi:hypothetical protein